MLVPAHAADDDVLRRRTLRETERRTLASDTFGGNGLGGAWEVKRRDARRLVVRDGRAVIVTRHSGPWAANDRIANLLVRRGAFATRDLEAQVEVEIQVSMQHHAAGLVLLQDDRNYLELSFRGDPHGYNLWRRFHFTKVTDGRPSDIARDRLGPGKAEASERFTFRIVRRGPRFEGWVLLPEGNAGEGTWALIGTHLAPSIGSPRVALKAANAEGAQYGGGAVSEIPVAFDELLVSAQAIERTATGGLASEGSLLHSFFEDTAAFARDFRVAVPLATHLDCSVDGLQISTRHGALGDARAPLRNIVFARTALPAGDYDLFAQATLRITSQHNEAGIALYHDDRNALLLGYYGKEHGYNLNRTFRFTKILDAEASTIEDPTYRLGAAAEEETVLFRIERRSDTYRASVLARNPQSRLNEWISVGEQTYLGPAPRLALFAANRAAEHYGSGPSHEIPVRFEQVVVRPIP